MKTIEERAEIYAYNTAQVYGDCCWIGAFMDYIEGAERQRDIDIEKACEWLNDILSDDHINSGMNKQRLLAAFREMMKK